MNVDAWALLTALAVIFLPLLLAGVLLARPARKHRPDPAQQLRSRRRP